MDCSLLSLKKSNILFIDDDPIVLREITQILTLFFSNVFSVPNGKKGFEVYEDKRPDVILMDLGLPDINGFTLIKNIREKDSKTPIIVLSGHSDSDSLLKAANSHIDGYIVKPVSLEALIIKLSDVIKKNHNDQAAYIRFKNGVEYNFDTKVLTRQNQIMFLTPKEERLFKLFVGNHTKVLTKEEIMDHIWPTDYVTDSAFKNLLSRFRGKIGEDMLLSIKSIGWRLNTDVFP